MAYLTIRIKGEEGYRRVPLDKDRMVLGRSSRCDLSTPAQGVSREHCAFERVADRWQVLDLGSSNGTRLGEHRVEGPRTLNERDIIKAGTVRCTFHQGDIPSEAEADDASDEPQAPTRQRAADDPPEAFPCGDCGRWISIAHRLPGERMPCPACGKRQTVPTLLT